MRSEYTEVKYGTTGLLGNGEHIHMTHMSGGTSETFSQIANH